MHCFTDLGFFKRFFFWSAKYSAEIMGKILLIKEFGTGFCDVDMAKDGHFPSL